MSCTSKGCSRVWCHFAGCYVYHVVGFFRRYGVQFGKTEARSASTSVRDPGPTRELRAGTGMLNDWLGSGLATLPRYAANFLPTHRSCAGPLVCLTDYRFCCFNQGLLDFVRGSWVSVIPPQLCVVLNEISPLLGGALIDKRCQLGSWCYCSLHGAIPWLTLRRRMAGRFAGGTWM